MRLTLVKEIVLMSQLLLKGTMFLAHIPVCTALAWLSLQAFLSHFQLILDTPDKPLNVNKHMQDKPTDTDDERGDDDVC
jgi:hypothetical protein